MPRQFFDLSGTAAGALVRVLVYEGMGYFYHRNVHASDLLWRGLHQMHHRAERIGDRLQLREVSVNPLTRSR